MRQQNARKRSETSEKESQKYSFSRPPKDGNPFLGNFLIGQTIGDSGQDNGCKGSQKQGILRSQGKGSAQEPP